MIAPWCNGNTSDFDSAVVGSSPAGAATEALGMETLYKSLLFKPGGRIRSVHPLKSDLRGATSLWYVTHWLGLRLTDKTGWPLTANSDATGRKWEDPG